MSGVLLVSGSDVEFLVVDQAVAPLQFRFSIAARPGEEAEVIFAYDSPAEAREEPEGAIVLEALGTQLSAWEDEDLLSFVLKGYFAAIAPRLPSALLAAPLRLYFPFWMGPQERRLLRAAAQEAGLTLLDGLERGLAPVLTHVWQGADVPPSGGWIVADRCGSSLDLYAISDRQSKSGREIGLAFYRRCPEIFSPYYRARPAAAGEAVDSALTPLPVGWGLLATDEQGAQLLRQRASEESNVAVYPFAEHPAALEAYGKTLNSASISLSRPWRYWLDLGDDPLQPIGDPFSAACVERLFAIPEPVPDHIRLGLRAGFHPARLDTQQICEVSVSRPDLHYAPGFLLVLLRFRGSGGGDFEVDVVQHGRSVHSVKALFSAHR
jgi:hypothetical protein